MLLIGRQRSVALTLWLWTKVPPYFCVRWNGMGWYGMEEDWAAGSGSGSGSFLAGVGLERGYEGGLVMLL